MLETGEKIIEINNLDELRKKLAKQRFKSSLRRFVVTLAIASFFLFIPILRPEDDVFTNYFLSVSAGAYGAAILYAFVEFSFIEKQNQETTINKLTILGEQILEYSQKVRSKHVQVIRLQKNHESLTRALETKRYGNNLEIELSLWKLRSELMWNLDELIHLMRQRDWNIEQAKPLLLELNMPDDRDTLLAAERRNRHELEQTSTLLDKVSKEYTQQTLNLG